MNKKVSTLLTVALTLGGSLLSSSAFATDVTATEFTGAIANGVLNVKTLAPDNVINLTEDVTLTEGHHLVIVKEDGVSITSKDGKTFKGHLLLAGDDITVSNLKLTSKDLLAVVRQGNWNSSIISVYADNVTIKGNTFEGAAGRTGAFNEAISLVPQSDEVNYVVEGNEFSGFTTDMSANNVLNTAIRINRGSNWMQIQNDDPNKTNLETAFKDSKLKGINNDVIGAGPSAYPEMSIESIVKGNEFETTTSNVILSGFDGDDVAEISFNELDEAAEKVLKKIATDEYNNLDYNAQILFEDAETYEVQNAITKSGISGTYVVSTNEANIIGGNGVPTMSFAQDNETVKAEGAFDAITEDSDGKSYTLKVEGGYLQSDLTFDAEKPAYWAVSYSEDGVCSFTSLDGKQLKADGKYTEFEIVETAPGASTFKLKVAGQYVEKGFVLGDGTNALEFGAHEVTSSTSINAAALNAVNEGSFSIDYRFDDDHVAEVNPFGGEVKAFDYEEYPGKVFFATSWPESANNKSELSESEFEKSVFVVATLDNKWNINNLKKDGEGAKFTEVQGKYLVANPTTDDLKAGKYSINNAGFTVTQNPVSKKYTLKLNDPLSYLDDNKLAWAGGNLKIALIDDEAGLIVTTIGSSYNENDDEIVVEGTITNSRTITVDKFLSTEKAKVFNIKFLSKNAAADKDNWTNKEKETYSEYNKYLGIRAAGLFAQGSEFVNLEAPENQWIVSAADKDAKTITFQNRENDGVKFTASLVKTDEENVYEIRQANNNLDYGFVTTDGEYVIASDNSQKAVVTNLLNTVVELTEVTPNAQAGYVTTELDNAGLVRFSFTANEYNNALVDDLFVTANDKNKVSVDKNEENAAQFSVVKFDAASTSTALSDTIYADNDYVIWNASDKKVETVEDGDTIAVVSYAFKQLRADGENYYLNAEMSKVEKYDDESKAPRFLVKINKNGSYSLINVDGNDYYRDIVKANAKTFDLNTKSAKAPITNDEASIYYEYENRGFDFNILKETPGTSYNHVPQHVTMEAVNGGYIAMNAENKEGIVAPVSTLKAEYTKEDLTFWLDTTDSEAVTPSFMISKAGNYMYNAVDSLNRYNDSTASAEKVEDFGIEINGTEYAKAIFQTADLTKVEDIENYKFQIVESADNADEYVIKSLNGYKYVAAHNQKLYFTADAKDALKVIVTRVEAPTSNEGVSATEVKVVANNGSINVKNAAGKNVVVSTILGQVVANEVLTSDNATINVPAGIVVVAVEGESFKVNVK